MNATRRTSSGGGFSPRLMLRLVSIVTLLVLIGMTISNLRKNVRQEQAAMPPADNAAAPAQPATDGTAPAEADDTAGATALAEVHGTTSGAPDDVERAAFADESESVKDYTTSIRQRDMLAYWRLVRWVAGQSIAELASEDSQPAVFNELMQHPAKHRGELVEVDLRIRQVISLGEMPADAPPGVTRLYQLVGWPTNSSGWIYYVVTPELPPGFPQEPEMDAKVRVYGYFLKLQAYQPADAKPNARPLVAPLIVGRVEWFRYPQREAPPVSPLMYIALFCGGAILAGVIGVWVVSKRRKSLLSRSVSAAEWNAPTHEEPGIAAEDDEPSNGPETDGFDWLRDERK